MMNINDRIDEKLANETPRKGLYFQLKSEYYFLRKRIGKDIW